MSLHAQLSPEAQARLAAQQRMSTITSLVIALLLMVPRRTDPLDHRDEPAFQEHPAVSQL
jgi:hypothetical protein